MRLDKAKLLADALTAETGKLYSVVRVGRRYEVFRAWKALRDGRELLYPKYNTEVVR
jgi:hypothetical protein